ncbi:MAG: iron-containing alcohol dehydrogenase [Tateyamaria sp.]|jgi:alcohol dehydrogenase class IV|uniref:iron-containing alcohol dehydrogenase n=1 Tax=Tateyamaria sp. TaxID=1929288 RepID=UPI0032DDCF04
MDPFEFNTTKSIVFRPGASAELADISGSLLGANVLFITDPGLRKLGLCNNALASLEAAGIAVTVFDQVEPDPSQATLKAALAAGDAAEVTGVVGFGGGSSLDIAKVAALLLGSREDLDKAWGVGVAKGPRMPLVLIPTTSGTGSEVTPVSIITVGTEEKRGISSPILLPDIAILDAELTLDLPSAITAATGVDAIVHAIEAYASANCNNNPLSKALAREALRLLGANIETVVAEPGNVEARGAMLLGSMLAGQAFANSPVASVHALAYPIGGTFHVPHGLSNALVLPHVLRFNAPVAYATYAEIAADAFPHLAEVEGAKDRCAALIDALAGLSNRLGLQTHLREVGIPKSALEKMAADAMLQTRLLVNNPRAMSEQDVLKIYEAAW